MNKIHNNDSSELSGDEFIRYGRQIMHEKIGIDGQKRLKKATVFIAGAGGLGSSVAQYLAAAGIGTLIICDFDIVQLSNLNRQLLHNDSRIGVNKALSAKKSITEINPSVTVVALEQKIDKNNIDNLVGDSDIIVDCLDNFSTRVVLNRYSLRHSVPFVFGGIWGLSGQVSFFNPPHTACFECLYQDVDATGVFPVLGCTPGMIGTIQAMEVIKHICGIGRTLQNQLLVLNGEEMDFNVIQLERNTTCNACCAPDSHKNN